MKETVNTSAKMARKIYDDPHHPLHAILMCLHFCAVKQKAYKSQYTSIE